MTQLPTGTITFLFTDIEGSTQLWERHPEAMSAALAHHDALLTAGIRQHRGQVVKSKGEGDSLFAVFDRASDAVAAACSLQQALQAEPWEVPVPLRVRMALHTAEAEQRDGDYYGPAINRCARLRAVAHGGQVLLSLAAQELVRDALPEAVSLKELGLCRLRDLQRPETIFQLLHPDLPADFPPLRTLDVHRHNLPVQPTSLIGRESEVARARDLLLSDEVRLLSFTGPGGTGKTRLALQVAAELLDAFSDGVYCAALASINDPELVASTIAQSLGIRETGGQPPRESLKAFLKEKQMLLLLDNFEQVVAAAGLVAELLASCPRLKVLVTSRTLLHLQGEREFSVPPLALPAPRRLLSVEALSQYAAVQLFIQRALDAKPEFAVTNENAPAVAAICARLDGLPLAIELAAARIKLLSPQALLERMESRLKLLTGGARDLPARQQTLRGAIAWSHDLLDESEKRLFRRLAAFVGGCTLEMAEAVCDPEGDLEIDLLDGITSLVEKSLLRQGVEATSPRALTAEGFTPSAIGPRERAEDEPRFEMLETIREYGLECLARSGEADAIRTQHAACFLGLAEEAEPELWSHDSWLKRLEAEHDNLRAALEWYAGSSPESGLRLAGALWWFWSIRGHRREARQRLETALARSRSAGVSLQWKALCAAGHITASLGEIEPATALGEESLARCRQDGDRAGMAWSLQVLSEIAWAQEAWTRVETLQEESLALFRQMEDRPGTALALHMLGYARGHQGDYERAVAREEESLALCRKEGYRWLSAVVLQHLGSLERGAGRMEAAAALYEESLAIHQEIGNKAASAVTLVGLSWVARAMGDEARAITLLEESLAAARECGNKRQTSASLEELGHHAVARGEYERATACYEEALILSRELNNKPRIAVGLLGLARVAQARGDDRTARALCQEAHALGPGTKTPVFHQGRLLLAWGDYAGARSYYEEGLALPYAADEAREVAWALVEAGHVAWLQGESVAAESYAVEALGLFQGQEDIGGILASLETLAVAAMAQGPGTRAGAGERAARLMGAAEALREALGLPATGWWRHPSERIRDAVRAASLEEAFGAAWAEGRAMSLEQAIASAAAALTATVEC